MNAVRLGILGAVLLCWVAQAPAQADLPPAAQEVLKQFEEETNLECHLLLDISASMAYRGAAPMSKLEYGSVLAASLAYLMSRQRDATGLIQFDDKLGPRLAASARPGHLHALLLALDRVMAMVDDVEHSEEADIAQPLERLRPLLEGKGASGVVPRAAPEAGRVGVAALSS